MLIRYYWSANDAESSFDALRLPGSTEEEQEPGSDPSGYAKRQAHYLDLRNRNPDLVGWLRVFETNVDYPVMQRPGDGQDGEPYYLHRDFDRENSSAGTLFASDISDVDRPSDLIIIYGHMMKSGAMFGGLKEYTDADYMKKHQVMRFDTMEEERFYRVFCVFTEAVNTGKPDEFRYYDVSGFEDEEAFDDFVDSAKSRELYDTGETAEYGDEILALSTCEYTHTDGRLVLLAKRYNPYPEI
jgi:sortase B